MPNSSASLPEIKIRPEPEKIYPPMAGLWSRIFAFLIDILLLGVISEGLGFVFSGFLFQIGPFGQLLGLVFIFPYFGIMNSSIQGGQTLGKKLFKIAVRGDDGLPIGLWRSFARTALLILPVHAILCLTFWINNEVISTLLSALVYGWEAAIIVLYLFNKQARQGSHDLLVKTYVIDLREDKEKLPVYPETSKSTLVVAALSLLVVIIGYSTFSIMSSVKARQNGLGGLYDSLSSDSRFFTVSLSNSLYLDTKGKTERTLSVNVWFKGDSNALINSQINHNIASLVFSDVKNISDYNEIQVKISSRRYLGLYSYNQSNFYSGTISDWKQLAGE